MEEARAAVFTGPGEALRLESFPLPRPGSSQLLVRVRCSSICGSDLHTYQGHRQTPTPTILGHEILGEVIEVGPGPPVRTLDGKPVTVGDRISWSIAASCGRCFFCKHSLPQKCERLFKYGHERLRPEHRFNGGLAEVCHLIAGTPVVSVPEGLPDAVACPANCATATVMAAMRAGGGCQGEIVLIQGAGMLGLTACALARSRGASRIIVCDVVESRLKQAERFGASHCVNVAEGYGDLAGTVKELSRGRGVDLALELSGAASAMRAAVPLLRTGGRYILVGAVFPSSPLSLDPERVVRGWLQIRGVHNYAPEDLRAAMTFLEQHHTRFPFSELLTRTFPLTEVSRAFQHAVASRALRVGIRP